MTEYVVIACYYGECYPSAHIMAARVQADSPQAAEARLAQYLQEVEGNQPGEVLALPPVADIPNLEQIQEQFWSASPVHRGPAATPQRVPVGRAAEPVGRAEPKGRS